MTPHTEKIHRRITVSGRVQGVFFRVSTRDAADLFGITGIVRNRPNGSVYIEAEGSEADMKKFIAWCHEGPRMASVNHVDVEEAPVQGYSDFEITR